MADSKSYLLGVVILSISPVIVSIWYVLKTPLWKRKEHIARFHAWERGNTIGAKAWRLLMLLCTISIAINAILRAREIRDQSGSNRKTGKDSIGSISQNVTQGQPIQDKSMLNPETENKKIDSDNHAN